MSECPLPPYLMCTVLVARENLPVFGKWRPLAVAGLFFAEPEFDLQIG